jgi:hypothetical protein
MKLTGKSTEYVQTLVTCVLVVAVAAFAACYPSPDLAIEDYDTVVTVVTEGADFSGYSTYFMPDSVFQRGDEGSVSRDFDDLILGDIHRNMQSLGYVYEADPVGNGADVLVVASTITQEHWSAYLGWPFFGTGLGGGFRYPTGGMRYLYTTGTVAIDMAEIAKLDPDENVYPVEWTASVSGPLQSSKENTADRITNGIDQAFAQSPYLKPDQNEP